MAIGKISGPMLQTNLARQGVDLSVDTDLAYFDVTNRRVGHGTNVPTQALDVPGNVRLANISILGNTITSNTGVVNLGSPGNITLSGGGQDYVLITDGNGNLTWANVSTIVSVTGLSGNILTLGSNTAGSLVSNAVSLTTSTSVTNAVAQLNFVLGKLVPPSPPAFPNATTLTINSVTSYGRMTTLSQVDNTGAGRSVAAGTTLANVLRSASYTTNTISNVGDGATGTLTVYLDNVAAGANTLVGGSGARTTGNLVIVNNQDYHNVVSSVTAGFWYSFSAYASGTVSASGYHSANIAYTGGPGTSTNTATWYYDAYNPGNPSWGNTSSVMSANSVTYSSTIPHANGNSQYRLKANVGVLSGGFYYSSDTFVVGSLAGAFQAPASVTYAQAGVSTPLAANLYVVSGSAYLETTANVLSTGFGSSSTGPSLTAYNSYGSTAQVFAPGVTVLYKNGTGTSLEETSIAVNSVGTGSGNAVRVVNPGSTDTPSYSAGATAFNSTTGPFYTYDATNVGSGTQGVIKFDQTNYSTGYFPVGPNLTGQGSNQYFTFKFIRTSVSKFDIKFSGTIAGLWVALPGSSMDTSSTLNGWATMASAYAGSGYPGAGTGGNGSNGCALGGVATIGSAVTNGSYTCTFGTLSSSGTATNEIYVRVKLTSGQSLTALTIETATH